MRRERKITLLFPVLNEASNIPALLQDLRRIEVILKEVSSEPRFLFVDDGSTDGTAALLRGAGLENLMVLQHERNLGPGAAFQTGFAHLLKEGLDPEDFVITLEGDSTSDPSLLKRMMKRSEEEDDIILASPYLYGGGFQEVRFHRVLISHFANGLVKLLLNIRGISTFSCFYRLYRGRALIKLNERYPDAIVTCAGFDCAVEILCKAIRVNLAISEVPFKVDWSRRQGKSKMRIFKTALQYIRMLFRLTRDRR